MKYHNLLLAAVASLSIPTSQAQQPETAASPAKALAMMATSIPCSDIDRSIAFYTKGLGMTAAGKMEMGKVIEVPLMFPGGGPHLLLQHRKPRKSADTRVVEPRRSHGARF